MAIGAWSLVLCTWFVAVNLGFRERVPEADGLAAAATELLSLNLGLYLNPSLDLALSSLKPT